MAVPRPLEAVLLLAVASGLGVGPFSGAVSVDEDAPAEDWLRPLRLASGAPESVPGGLAFAFDPPTPPLRGLRVSFPQADVVRLTFDDAAGERPVEAGAVAPRVHVGSTMTRIETDWLRLELDRDPFDWRLFDRRGRLVTGGAGDPYAVRPGATWQSGAMPAYTTDLARVALDLGGADHVYGLGQRFNAVDQHGMRLRSWICDCLQDGSYVAKGDGYFMVPFFWTERGWGGFLNTTADVEWDVGDTDPHGLVATDPSAQPLDLYLFAPGSPRAVLDRYTDLVGKPTLPPRWSFEQWVDGVYGTEDGLIKGGEAAMRAYLAELEAAQIPVRNLVVEDWTLLWWMGARWQANPATFPDLAGFVRELKDGGHRVMLWETPAIGVANTEYPEAAAMGYFAKDATGLPYVITPANSGGLTFWMQGVSIVDFTNPEARAWWDAKHDPLLAMGMDGYKADGGEEPTPDMVFADGSTGVTAHNRNAMLYNRALHDGTRAARGEAALISRSGGVGSHLASGIWNGDQNAGFSWLQANVRAGLSASHSGLYWWTFDQGGLSGTMTREEHLRNLQANVFAPWFKLHVTWDHPRPPWDYDADALATYRYYSNARLQLLDYLYAEAEKAHATGVPLVRAPVLDFPADEALHGVWTQFMVGDRLLAAPMLFEGETARDVHLPRGTWVDLATGERIRGPVDLHGYAVPQELLPLFWLEDASAPAPVLPAHPALPSGWTPGYAAVRPHEAPEGEDLDLEAIGIIPGPTVAGTNPLGPADAWVPFPIEPWPAGDGWVRLEWESGPALGWLQQNYLNLDIVDADGDVVRSCGGGSEILCHVHDWPSSGEWRAHVKVWQGVDVRWKLIVHVPY